MPKLNIEIPQGLADKITELDLPDEYVQEFAINGILHRINVIESTASAKINERFIVLGKEFASDWLKQSPDRKILVKLKIEYKDWGEIPYSDKEYAKQIALIAFPKEDPNIFWTNLIGDDSNDTEVDAFILGFMMTIDNRIRLRNSETPH